MGSGIAKELADFSLKREARLSSILTKAADVLSERIEKFVKNFYKTNAKTIEKEFVISNPASGGITNGGVAKTVYTVQQYKLFQDFEAGIDSMIQTYLEDNSISKGTFLKECQDSLDDKYAVFLEEDQNKWFVEALIAHASFEDFFRLMRSRHAQAQMIEKLDAQSVHLFPKPDAGDAAPAPAATSGAASAVSDPATREHDLDEDLAQVKAPEIDMDMTLLAEASVALKARIDEFIASFCSQHAAALRKEFVGVSNAEYTLGQHALFSEYHDGIDLIIDEYLADKGTTKKIFIAHCKASLEDQFCALFDEDANKWFVETLIGYTEFKHFFHVMVDKQTQVLIDESASQKEDDMLYEGFS